MHDAALGVVRHQGSRVPLVDLKARADGVGRIVGAVFLCRPGGETPDELFLWHVEQQDFTEALAALAEGGIDELRLRSEEHTSELQSRVDLVCRLLLEKKK